MYILVLMDTIDFGSSNSSSDGKFKGTIHVDLDCSMKSTVDLQDDKHRTILIYRTILTILHTHTLD